MWLSFMIPDFVPVPNDEVLLTISLASMVVGVIFIIIGIILYFILKKKEKNIIPAWIVLIVGVVLFLNHIVQLLI
ncbi:MAG: hypothetical protein HFH68_12500 [Lachnospiraceae bacterium]|nr:hypothetical protein [Lachnospiraceae bacterium]